MFYEDRISMATPEGVTLDVTLAGVGSRFTAGLLDQLLRLAMLGAFAVLEGLVGAATAVPGGVLVAAFVVAVFVVQFGYDVAFETAAAGRTPGKRWTGIRVVSATGAPIGFGASAVRNVLRIVDALPGFYLVGMLCVLFTARNQRLGDLAAGTVVVRDRGQTASGALAPPQETSAGRPVPSGPWDVSAVTADDLATVRRYLQRRPTLSADARDRLALELANRLGAKVVGPAQVWDPEDFLEYLVSAKADRG